jgi:serine/threonine protein kinase
MELVNGVSLLTFLKSKPNRKIEENECKQIFYQIVKGIAHIHSKNICHRDIKLENIIVEENKLVKIIDFGFGTVTVNNKLLNFFCGTPSYMPPEIVQKKEYIGNHIANKNTFYSLRASSRYLEHRNITIYSSLWRVSF